MKRKRGVKHCPDCPTQCFCGSSKQLEANHLGGRNHVPWLTLPFCRKDHTEFHRMCTRAGIDFRDTSNQLVSLIRALKAMLVGMWMVVDKLEKDASANSDKAAKDDSES
jgi:hypothetical protein